MKLKNVDKGNAFDWGLTSAEYARFRDIYPPVLYEKLRGFGVAADGTSWLDIGTGTGILPQNLYNENARIFGADISEKQIEFAQKTAAENGWNIEYIAAPAEHTGLPDNAFDFITAAQCFWYFDREIMRSEIRRMLKPEGVFVKVYLDFVYDDEITAKSLALVKRFNPEWELAQSYRDMFDDLFAGRQTEILDCEIPFTRENWHGRMCACRGTLASMNGEAFEKWSAAHKQMLSEFPKEFTVKHRLYITYFKLD